MGTQPLALKVMYSAFRSRAAAAVQSIREGPIDYYQMGNDYVGTMVDWNRSVMGNAYLWDDIERQVAAGENIVFFANHQSEADAAFIPLLTRKTHPGASSS